MPRARERLSGISISKWTESPFRPTARFPTRSTPGFGRIIAHASFVARRERRSACLDSLVRGVYAKHQIRAGQTLSDQDVYLAVPLLKGQLSCRELMNGEVL